MQIFRQKIIQRITGKEGRRIVKFALVGLSGVVVNEALTGVSLWTLSGLEQAVLRTNLAVLTGWLVSVLTNYYLNVHWTWSDRFPTSADHPYARLGKYYLTALAAFVVQLAAVNLLAASFGWTARLVLAWNLVGIAVGAVVNYVLADRWVFGDSKTTRWGLILVVAVVLGSLLKTLIVRNLGLLPDEAYYWEWSRRLAWGYFDHPPMIAWFLRLATLIFGHSAHTLRLSAILLSGGSSLIMFALGREIIGAKRAFWAVVAFNLTLIFMVGSLVITPDIPLVFFWTLTLYLTWLATTRGQTRYWLLTGLAAGGALLSKYTAVLLFPAVLIFLLLSPADRRWLREPGPYLAVMAALLIFSPAVWWNSQHNWVSFAFQLGHGFTARSSSSWSGAGEFLGGQAAMISPLLFLIYVVAVPWIIWRGITRSRREWLFLGTASAVVFLFFFITSLSSPPEANWAVCSYVTGFLALAAVFPATAKWHNRFGIVAVTVMVLISALALVELSGGILPVKPNRHPVARAQGWEQLAQAVERTLEELHQPVVIMADRYQFAAELAFVLPQDMVITCFAPHRRQSQYTIWNGDTPLTGATVLFIAKGTHLPPAIQNAFGSVQLLRSVEMTWQGAVIRRATLYLCNNFNPDYG